MGKFSFSSLPRFRLLSKEAIEAIHVGALEVLEKTGVMYKNPRVISILAGGGAEVDEERGIVRFPQDLVREAIRRAPSSVRVYSRDGKHDLVLEGDNVYFNPGSTAINVLDSGTGEIREPLTKDLVEFVRLTDALENVQAQSTAMVASDVPEIIADMYRLYIVLKNSTKAVVTGAFTVNGVHEMRRMLSIVAGGEEACSKKPMAIFDVCPSPPLMWSEITSQNLIDCAGYGIPVEIVSMPLSGATGPVTLAGSVVQHTVESLSGLVLAQLVRPGTPVIYGGSPAVFDMRFLTTPMGAIETMMIDCAYSEIGKYYGLPTHAYIGLSDSKVVDMQAGFESGIGLIMGALAGVNVISAPGMLDFESCQSLEKLVIDNEICGMALRLIRGLDVNTETLAVDLIESIGPSGQFLTAKHTLKWFRREHFVPSHLIDRLERGRWRELGSKDVFQRAREVVKRLLAEHTPEPLLPDMEKDLDLSMREAARKYGISTLPVN